MNKGEKSFHIGARVVTILTTISQKVITTFYLWCRHLSPAARGAANQAVWLQRGPAQTDVLRAKGSACHTPLPAPCSPRHARVPVAAAYRSADGYGWGVCVYKYIHTQQGGERETEKLCVLNYWTQHSTKSSVQALPIHTQCYKTHPLSPLYPIVGGQSSTSLQRILKYTLKHCSGCVICTKITLFLFIFYLGEITKIFMCFSFYTKSIWMKKGWSWRAQCGSTQNKRVSVLNTTLLPNYWQSTLPSIWGPYWGYSATGAEWFLHKDRVKQR